MKSRLADINQPLMPNREAVEAERQIKRDIADHRRQVIKGRDPRAKDKPSWKMRDERPGPDDPRPPAPSIWRAEFNERNCIDRLTQISPMPPPSVDSSPKWRGRKFRVKITEPCSFPEGSLEPGAIIECFAESAFGTVQAGKGIIEEEFAAPAPQATS